MDRILQASRHSRRLLTRRNVAIATAATTASGLVYVGAIQPRETRLGLERQTRFWSKVLPIIFDYYWHLNSSSPYVKYKNWRQKSKAESVTDGERPIEKGTNRNQKDNNRAVVLKELHAKHAPEILQVMIDLKGLYIKLGQVLSVTALPVPEEYRKLFRTLQSDVPGWDEFDQVVKPVLEKELGAPLSDIFSFVDPIPCGAASIGQAHRATLLGSEEDDDVIIKVQYPDASWQVPSDIHCVGDFLKICVWAGVVDESAAKLSFDEFSRQFITELDYQAERRNLELIYESSIQADSPYQKHGVVLPRVLPKLCSKKVITMTYLPGPKLEAEARQQMELLGIDSTRSIRDLVQDVNGEEQSNVIESGTTTSGNVDVVTPLSWKAQAANLVGQVVGINSILWSIRMARRVFLWSTAQTVSLIQVASPLVPESWSTWADDHKTAMKQSERLALTESWIAALFDVHGDQIFNLGVFNADAHPGNILVVEEGNSSSHSGSKLGLIDFGQCKHLTHKEQAQIAKLILAVANDEQDESIATAFRELGIRTKHNSTEFLADFARLMFGPLKPYHLSHSWHKKLHKMDHVEYFPNELAMVYRASLLLRGLAVSLQVNVSVGESWKPHAQAAWEKHGHLVVAEEQPKEKKALNLSKVTPFQLPSERGTVTVS